MAGGEEQVHQESGIGVQAGAEVLQGLGGRGLGGADRAAEDLGDLGVAEVFVVPEDERRALAGWERLEFVADPGARSDVVLRSAGRT
nr:hypothetical protein [Kribbella sp. VKM Ac-2527]